MIDVLKTKYKEIFGYLLLCFELAFQIVLKKAIIET